MHLFRERRGVDVVSDLFAVSVKNYSGSVPVEDLREIFGVATLMGKVAVLWTSGSLTEAGRAFAEVAPVHVVRYDVLSGEFEGITPGRDGATRPRAADVESGVT
ncbi:restriction endonuclease [Agrococcus sediminis]|uniref:restriction endonuclease n=1 Tax=Agrococcus sediminis TaxID=2599924 RepID=UPI00343B08B1